MKKRYKNWFRSINMDMTSIIAYTQEQSNALPHPDEVSELTENIFKKNCYPLY